jgi:PAS domain S-box-containing protein
MDRPSAEPDGASEEAERIEAERLEALRRYDVLDTPPEEAFDRITRLATGYFDMPIALVSLVSAGRQWFKSCHGINRRETDRELSFCQYALDRGDPLVVPDATQDPRFAENPLVTGAPGIRFYAGAPLVTPAGGYPLGTLCVLDREPHTFGDEEKARLEDFAAMAMDALEQRRKRMQEGREVEYTINLYEQMVRSMPVEMAVFDREKRFVFIKENTVSDPDLRAWLIGKTEADYCRRCDADPERARRRSERIQHVLDTGETVQFEETLPGPGEDDRQRHFLRIICPVRGREGRITHAVSYGLDITERKRNERKLRASEKRYRTLMNAANDAIFVADAESGRLLSANPKAQELVGRSEDELRGMHHAKLHPPGKREAYRAVFNQHAEQESVTEDLLASHKSGREIPVSVSASVVEMEGQRCVLAIFRDVTARKRYEEQLVSAKERAEELLEAKTHFLNNMSHELRTPLASITGFAEVLAEDDGGGEHRQEFAQRIARSGERLERTLQSVLDVASMEGDGAADLSLEPTNVARVVRRSADRHRPAADEKDLTFEVQDAAQGERDARALLNEDALHRILDNLLSNAIKFTDAGRVTVEVRSGTEDVRIRVADTGIGIEESFREDLFEEFTQESTGLSRTHQGSGLGLAIARRLAEEMNGAIDVESTKGEGSVFTVRFPRLAAAEEPPGVS